MWTPAAEAAWTTVYGVVKENMLLGAAEELAKQAAKANAAKA